MNHGVDYHFISNDSILDERKGCLIASAGVDHMNYLRSMVGDSVFFNAPQEFFASISNAWFTDSKHTMDLGVLRFKNGRLEPINQALFFAEVYSLGGDSTFFYTIDTLGNINRQNVPLERDTYGHIQRLHMDDTTYSFMLDSLGNVTSLSDPTDVQDEQRELLYRFSLRQNYPNPFNPTTEISFSLPNAADVKLEIFNIMGQKVATLTEGHLEAGGHKFQWDASRVASGIYFYRLDADDYSATKKMVLLK